MLIETSGCIEFDGQHENWVRIWIWRVQSINRAIFKQKISGVLVMFYAKNWCLCIKQGCNFFSLWYCGFVVTSYPISLTKNIPKRIFPINVNEKKNSQFYLNWQASPPASRQATLERKVKLTKYQKIQNYTKQ